MIDANAMRAVAAAALAGNPDPAADFYAQAGEGKFNRFHPFIAGLRLDDAAALEEIVRRATSDKGREFAVRSLLTPLFNDELRRRPIGWEPLADYMRLAHALQGSKEPALKAIGGWILAQAGTFVRAHRTECPDPLKEMCSAFDNEGDALAKFQRHCVDSSWERCGMKLLGQMQKWRNKLMPSKEIPISATIDAGTIERKKVAGARPGFEIEELFIGGRKTAVLIVGNPSRGARVGAEISVGGGVSWRGIERAWGERLQFQGPAAFNIGAKKMPELAYREGVRAVDLPPNPDRNHGYVLLFPDGSLRIVDKRRLPLAAVTRRESDAHLTLNLGAGMGPEDLMRFDEAMRAAKASSLPALLMIANGEPFWSAASERDDRRLLVEFGDGSFGVIGNVVEAEKGERSSTVPMTMAEIVRLALRAGESRGGVHNAVYLDTGYYDNTSYYLSTGGERRRVVIGHPDDAGSEGQSNRIVFYQGEKP